MVEKSRIRVNPQSKEIEIEGSEKFVKTYFHIIEKMLSEDEGKFGQAQSRKSNRKQAGKKSAASKSQAKGKSVKTAGKKVRRGDISNTLIELVKENNGVTTAELVKRSGFAEQQVRSVIYRAQKLGQITKQKRGVYVAA